MLGSAANGTEANVGPVDVSETESVFVDWRTRRRYNLRICVLVDNIGRVARISGAVTTGDTRLRGISITGPSTIEP